MAQLAPNTPSAPTETRPAIPVLLLKTKSSPTDAYEELFASASAATAQHGSSRFDPLFVPVLEHRFDDDGVARLRDLLVRREIQSCRHPPATTGAAEAPKATSTTGHPYGGVIFTSQRAVEAFASVVKEVKERGGLQGDSSSSGVAATLAVPTEEGDDGSSTTTATTWPHLHDVPVYSVGPATTRALRAVAQDPPLQVHGDHTGNGEDLAHFIREHYTDAHHPSLADATPRPLLFVVGEKRRDIIPKVLGRGRSIPVDELVVYGTGVMASFADDFQRALAATKDRPVRWAVVFSPTGCDSLLASLGLLDPATGKVHGEIRNKDGRSTFVATIGPTTRTHLQKTFGFEPDVCADEPSPAGVLRGITQFMASRGL